MTRAWKLAFLWRSSWGNTSEIMQKSKPIAKGCNAPPKSAKRSTFSHKMGQKWGFCRRVKGSEVQKSKYPLFGFKRSTFLGSCTPQIDPGYGPEKKYRKVYMFMQSSPSILHVTKNELFYRFQANGKVLWTKQRKNITGFTWFLIYSKNKES